jgi:hypothetical protein
MAYKEELKGGRIGKIFKIGNDIVRPSNDWSKNVHSFLEFIIGLGCDFIPKPISINDENEVLSYVPGEVYNYPLPEMLKTDEIIIEVAKLLSKYHRYSEKYMDKINGNEKWMLRAREPMEVMCHGDFAPYNVTFIDDKPFGIIDFDTLHPGPKIWDVSYAVYRWAPLKNPKNPDSFKTFEAQVKRTKIFLDVYGFNIEDRNLLVDTLIIRLSSLVNFMKQEAENGNIDSQRNLDDGHHILYLDDIEYLKDNKELITNKITA